MSIPKPLTKTTLKRVFWLFRLSTSFRVGFWLSITVLSISGGEALAQWKEEEPKQVIKATMTREQTASMVSRFDTVPDSDTLYTLTLPSPVASLALDKLGNVFVITQRGEVLRYDSLGKLQANYRELRYGQPAYIDVSDPYNLILSYPQAARVTILDNNLVSKGLISLPSKTDGGQGGAASGRNAVACRSADGNLWFWDDLAFRLVKVNSATGAVIQEGELLQASSFTSESMTAPKYLIETDKHVYVVLEEGLVLEYDFFGAFKHKFWLIRGSGPQYNPVIKPGELPFVFQGQSLNGELITTDGRMLLDYRDFHWLKSIGSLRKSTGLWALGGPYLAEADSKTGLTLKLRRY
jgi:hypothetical protein